MISNNEPQFSSNKNNNCSFSEPGLFTQLQQNNNNKSASFIQSILSFYSSFKADNKDKSNSLLSIDDAIQLLVKTIKVHFQLLMTVNDIEYDTLIKVYLNDLKNQLISNAKNNVSTYNKNYCIKLTNEDIIQKINQKIKEKISARDSANNSPNNSLRNSYELVTNDYFNNFKKKAQSQINSPIVRLSKIKMNKISNTMRKNKEGNKTFLNDSSSDLTLSHRNYNYQKRKSLNSEVNNNMKLERNASCCSCLNRNFTFLYNGIKPSPYTSFLVQKGRKIVNDYNKIGKSKERKKKVY